MACHRLLHTRVQFVGEHLIQLLETLFPEMLNGAALPGSGLVPAVRQPGSKQPPWKFVVVLLVYGLRLSDSFC